MMPVEVISVLLTNKMALEILKKIAEMRSVRFKDILESIDPQSVKKSRKQVEDAVKFLKDKELIKERSAPIEDFKSYYVTADGLSAASELRRSKL